MKENWSDYIVMHLMLYSPGAPNAGFHVLYIRTNNKQKDKQKIQRLLARFIFLLKTYLCVSFGVNHDIHF